MKDIIKKVIKTRPLYKVYSCEEYSDFIALWLAPKNATEDKIKSMVGGPVVRYDKATGAISDIEGYKLMLGLYGDGKVIDITNLVEA